MLEDIIKIIEINKTGTIIQKDGVISAIFKLESSGGYESTPGTSKEIINQNLYRYLESLPPNTSIQIIYDYKKKKFQPEKIIDTELFSSFLAKHRNEHLSKDGFLDEEIYISIGVILKRKQLTYFSEIINCFSGKSNKIINAYNDLLLMLKEQQSNFLTFCDENSLEAKRLNQQKCYSLLYEYLNNSATEDEFNPEHKTSNLVNKNLNFSQKDLAVGNEFLNAISLKLQPKEVSAFIENKKLHLPFLSSLRYGIDFPHRTIVTIVKDEHQKILQRIRNIKSLAIIFGGKSEKNLSKINSIKNFITYIEENNLSLNYLNIAVFHRNTDKKQLNARTNSILSKFRTINQASGILETHKTLDLFVNNIPGCHFNLKNMIPVTTELASNYVNFNKFYDGEKNGVLLKNRKSKTIKMDIRSSKLDNYNSIIIGPTGSGKSFTTQYLISQFIENDQVLIGIDKGQSSRHTFELHNAKIYDFDFDKPLPLNPFYIHPDNRKKGKINFHKLEFLTNYISFLCKDNNQRKADLPKSLISEINNLIPKLYEKKEEPILEDFYKLFCSSEMPSVPDKNKYEANIKSYIDREVIAQFINCRGSINIEKNQHTYFDIKNISSVDDLTALVAMSIIDLCYDLLETGNHKFINIFTDEAWDILQNPDLGLDKFLIYLFREIRKKNGGVTAIAQAASDFEFSQSIKDAIMNNFDTLIILRQNDKSIKVTKNVFDLSDYQVEYISSIQKVNGKFAEIYIKQKQLETILRIEPSELEYWMYNTTPADIEKKKILIAECNGNVLTAAKKMLEEN